MAEFCEEDDRSFFIHDYLCVFTMKRLGIRMRNTRKMKTVDFYFFKMPKILPKIRSFLDNGETLLVRRGDHVFEKDFQF